MNDEMTRCSTCGFEWETRGYENCGHEDAIAAGAARATLRDGLADLAEAIMLMGTALGFDNDTGNEIEDAPWRDFAAQATAWSEKMSALYPELNTDEQFNAACERLERMATKPRP